MELGTTVPETRYTKWRAFLGAACLLVGVAVFVTLQPHESATQPHHSLSDRGTPQATTTLRGEMDEDLKGDDVADYGDEVLDYGQLEADEGSKVNTAEELEEIQDDFEEEAPDAFEDTLVAKSGFPGTDFATTLSEVRKAVTPWSANKTHYSFNIHFCEDGNINTCSRGPSGYFSRRRAGCTSAPNCKVFYTDCSGFVGWNLIASTKGPRKLAIYNKLKTIRKGMLRPLAKDFYAAFKSQQDKHNADTSVPWKHVPLKYAQVGDVLAWHHAPGKHTTTGHVMMIAGKPQYKGRNQKRRREYWVEIADSTGHAHGWDTRENCHNKACGVGFGTMAYETLANGDISGFQWVAGHRRRSVVVRSQPIIVGRFIR